jgi:hypothetical protein
MPILSASIRLQSLWVDYLNTFAQAHFKEDIIICILLKCMRKHRNSTAFHLKVSLCGLQQSALCWFDKLSDGFRELGWIKPFGLLELCLFTKKGIVCFIYIDDCFINEMTLTKIGFSFKI